MAQSCAALPGEAPELVQAADWSPAAKTPIFLIHDGGGTIFAYHCLDPLQRFVYGIPNPYFACGSRFAGGLPEMGRLYAKRIRAAVARPDFPAVARPDGAVDILLGGWSLGGLLSLEVARLLADDACVRVVGILMVDSVCPVRPADYAARRLAPPDNLEEGKYKNQILAQRCMAEARRMVADWDVPTWHGRHAAKRPRMVLLRATDFVPTDAPAISSVDVSRDEAALGWGRHDDAMFDHVAEVQGHHFDLFALERIESTTAAIRRALHVLDAAASTWPTRGNDRRIPTGS